MSERTNEGGGTLPRERKGTGSKENRHSSKRGDTYREER